MALEEIEDAPRDLDDVAALVLGRAWKSSPWLILSLVFHGGVLAILPLIIFAEKLKAPETTPITISVDAKRIDPDRPYTPVTSAPPSREGTGLDEPPITFPDAIFADRHESLRTIFPDTGGEPRQHILSGPAAHPPLTITPADDAGQVAAAVAAAAGRGFDLAVELPWRAELVAGPAGERVLVLTAHHVATDGW